MPPPGPEAVDAAQRAGAIVDRAVAAGSWGDDDASAIRALMPALDASDRDEVFRRLATAINEQRLRPTTRHIF